MTAFGSAAQKRPLKLALVSPYDFAYPGGVTEHVVNLARQFEQQDHQVDIVVPSSDDETEPRIGEQVRVHRIGRVVSIPANGSVARITLSLRSYLQTKRLLVEQQYDLVHLHEPMIPALPLTVLRHSSTVNVGTFHAARRKPLAYFYSRPILKPFFRKLHGHIAVSTAARDFVGEYFHEADYEIIPNGIDYTYFATPRPPLERFLDGRPNVLFVGRMEKRKGLRFLLRAWCQVRETFPQARLVIVGSGRPLEGYRRYARRQGWSDEDVHFAGYVSRQDLPRYYQAATVFCAPATGGESFGIILLEAMAAGVPVVASSIPGYSGVLNHGEEGLLVEPENPAVLTSAIQLLLLNPDLRHKMGARGLATARQYDWPRIAGQVLDYYREVLDHHATAPERGLRFQFVRRMVGLISTSSSA